MTRISPEISERPLLLHTVGLAAGFAAGAIILALFTFSVIEALREDGRPATTTGPASNRLMSQPIASLGAGATGTPRASVPSELLAFTLCGGGTVITAIGRGPIYHMYILDLLSETASVFPADERIPRANCIKAGSGESDFH